MSPLVSSATPVSAPPAASEPRGLFQGTKLDGPIGVDDTIDSSETKPVAFAAEPATIMFDPFRIAARGVIVDERKLPVPPEEFAVYVDTSIPGPPETTLTVPLVPGTTQQADAELEYQSCANAV